MSAVAASHSVSSAEKYRPVFDAQSRANDRLTEWRRKALDGFIARGFPTQRDEDWKYTNLRRLETRNFVPAHAAPTALDNSNWIANAGMRIALVNGRWMPALSNAAPQPPGVTILTLSQWIANNPDDVAAFLTRGAEARSAFELMNDAFFEDGVVIRLGESVTLDQPIYIAHEWTDGSQLAMSHPKILLHAGANSHCVLIEHYLGAPDAETLTNTCLTLDIGAGARVSHYRLQQESTRSFHIGTVRARLDRDSRYDCQDVALGSGLSRTSITASLEGAGAEANLRGLFTPQGSQHMDTYTLVDHVAAHTQSNEEYRGIADGRGRGVYRGKVIVRKDAQKIDSRQSSRNLLLAPTAEIDTRPELEIYANDVKCSHGATTGQLDATALFYLRSRGLSEAAARGLLIRAFAESILSTIESQPVRDYLEHNLHDRFAGIEVPT